MKRQIAINILSALHEIQAGRNKDKHYLLEPADAPLTNIAGGHAVVISTAVLRTLERLAETAHNSMILTSFQGGSLYGAKMDDKLKEGAFALGVAHETLKEVQER